MRESVYLTRCVLGFEFFDGAVVLIPEGSIVSLVRGAQLIDIRMIHVLWNGSVTAVFADDIFNYGDNIKHWRHRQAGGNNRSLTVTAS